MQWRLISKKIRTGQRGLRSRRGRIIRAGRVPAADEARTQEIIQERIHAYESQLFDKIYWLCLRSDTSTDELRKHLQEAEIRADHIENQLGRVHTKCVKLEKHVEDLKKSCVEAFKPFGGTSMGQPGPTIVHFEVSRVDIPEVVKPVAVPDKPVNSLVVVNSDGEAVANHEPESEDEA